MEKRYVWNAKMPEWGYGLVRSKVGKKLVKVRSLISILLEP